MDTTKPAEFNYHILRYALSDFSQNVANLNEQQYLKVQEKAEKSYQLESLVLASPEANNVHISSQQIEKAFDQISSQYNDQKEFLLDLDNNKLNEESLRQALKRELLFDAVMQRVIAENCLEVSETDINLFYELHKSRFETPETRLTRHILITINEEFPENSFQSAQHKITEIEEKLKGRYKHFADFASRFSECPSAMEGGKLGDVQQGQLYPELDKALFKMQENEISSIIQTEMGFHILWCEKINAKKVIPIDKAIDKIRQSLQTRNEHNCQKKWLKELQQKSL